MHRLFLLVVVVFTAFITADAGIDFQLFTDVACTIDAGKWWYNLTSSSACDSHPDVGVSRVVLCSTVNSTTTFNLSTWSQNNNTKCSGTPTWNVNATGAEGGYLPTTELLRGIKLKGYARIDCNSSHPSSSLSPSFFLPPPSPLPAASLRRRRQQLRGVE